MSRHFSARTNMPITLSEYESLCKHPNGEAYGYRLIPAETFDRLERFILETSAAKEGVTEESELMAVGSRRGAGRIITARNYVGLIVFGDGSQIEILPKLYKHDGEESHEPARQTLLHMLHVIGDIPSKVSRQTGLGTSTRTILDIFIRMFVEEAVSLVKRGLKSDYREHEDNERFYKGKLQVAQHIRHNAFHKERFFIRYDEFSTNRAENRLIKTTLERLVAITRSSSLQKEIRMLLNAFDTVPSSVDPARDWANVSTDRTVQEYKALLGWCRIFLEGRSFTPFGGGDQAYALLFPMEKVFERYVAILLKKRLAPLGFEVSAQDQTHKLFSIPSKFQLRPDLVARSKTETVVLDTKWKLLSSDADVNYGISQSDMYQAYAYGKKYRAEYVYLVYPRNSAFATSSDKRIAYDSGDGVKVEIFLLDLELRQECIEELARKLSSS